MGQSHRPSNEFHLLVDLGFLTDHGTAFTWKRLRRHPWQQPRPELPLQSSTVLRPGDLNCHPVLVPPSEVEDIRSTEVGKVLLERVLQVLSWSRCLLRQWAGGSGLMTMLNKHLRQNSKVELITERDARYTRSGIGRRRMMPIWGFSKLLGEEKRQIWGL